MIKNDQQLEAAASEAGRLLQEIQNYLGEDRGAAARVRFPRGFIKPVNHYERRIESFIADETLRRNLSYNFMLSNVYLWLLNRTDITAIAAAMVIKAAIALAGSLCESMLKHALNGKVSRKQRNFKGRTEYLLDNSLISQKEKDDLDWLWDTRNNIHIEGVKESEYDKYSRVHHKRAAGIVRNLVLVLERRANGPDDAYQATDPDR